MKRTVIALMLAAFLLLCACAAPAVAPASSVETAAPEAAPAAATPEPTPTATPSPTPEPTPTPVPATDVIFEKDGFVIRYEGYGKTDETSFHQFSVVNPTDETLVLFSGEVEIQGDNVHTSNSIIVDRATYGSVISQEGIVAVAPNATTWVYMGIYNPMRTVDIPNIRTMTLRFTILRAGPLEVVIDTGDIDVDMRSTHISGIDMRKKARAEAIAANEYAGVMFSGKALNGDIIDQSIVSEHTLTVVQFWATWCAPCKKELPMSAKLYPEYAEKGCAFLGIQTDADTAAAKALWEKYEMPYPSIQDCGDLHEIYLIEITNIPTTILYDQNGNRVGEPHVGAMTEKEMRAMLDDALGNSPDATAPAAASPDPS